MNGKGLVGRVYREAKDWSAVGKGIAFDVRKYQPMCCVCTIDGTHLIEKTVRMPSQIDQQSYHYSNNLHY